MGALFALTLRTSATPVSIPANLRVGVTLMWLFAVWYFSQQSIQFRRRLDNESFVLTTVSARTAVGSILLTEFLSACLVLILPTVALVGVIGYAFRYWMSIALIPLTTVLFAASTTVVGSAVGFAYLHLSARSQSINQQNYTVVVRLLVILLIITVVITGFVPQVELPAVGQLAWLPPSWLIDLAAFGTPSTASLTRAIAGLLGTVVVVGSGSVAVERLATAYWYGASGTADAAETIESGTGNSAAITPETDALAAALSPLFVPKRLSTPTRRVAQGVLLRLRRSPRRLSFFIGPILPIVVIFLVQAANPLRLIPTVCAIAIPWLVGAVIGLNPLGDEGAALPTTLTSISGREFVRGLMVPGVVYGLPLTIVCTLIAGVFSPYTVVELGGLVVVGSILTVVAVVVAPALGVRFPRFDAIVVGQRGGVVLPSLTALAIYSALVGTLGRLATVTLLGSAAIDRHISSFGLSIDIFRLGGTASALIIALAVGWVSYHSAVSHFTTYTLD
jgi:ABC-2 type transport system permease protein